MRWTKGLVAVTNQPDGTDLAQDARWMLRGASDSGSLIKKTALWQQRQLEQRLLDSTVAATDKKS